MRLYWLEPRVPILSVSPDPPQLMVVTERNPWAKQFVLFYLFHFPHPFFPSTAPCQYAHKLAFLVNQNLHSAPSTALNDRLWYLWLTRLWLTDSRLSPNPSITNSPPKHRLWCLLTSLIRRSPLWHNRKSIDYLRFSFRQLLHKLALWSLVVIAMNLIVDAVDLQVQHWKLFCHIICF